MPALDKSFRTQHPLLARLSADVPVKIKEKLQ